MHADGKSTLASVSKWNSRKVNCMLCLLIVWSPRLCVCVCGGGGGGGEGGVSNEKVQGCSSNNFRSKISQDSIFLGMKISIILNSNFWVKYFVKSKFSYFSVSNLYLRSFQAKCFKNKAIFMVSQE